MKSLRHLALCGAPLLCSAAALAQHQLYQGFCTSGASRAQIQGMASSNYQQSATPSCLVTVYQTGTTQSATIYALDGSTPKANPFTAAANGYYAFEFDGVVDVTMSGAGMMPTTLVQVGLSSGSFSSLVVTSLTATSLQVGTITATTLNVNNIVAQAIATGTLNATTITATTVNAGTVNATSLLARNVNGVRYADGFATGSATCGITEAISDLPSTGGTVMLPLGVCTPSASIGVYKPVILQGHGGGGSKIVSGLNVLFAVGGVPSNSDISGIQFRDVTVQIVSANTAFNLSGTLRNLVFSNVFVTGGFTGLQQPGGVGCANYIDGLIIQGGFFNSNITGIGLGCSGRHIYINTQAQHNSGTGIRLSGSIAADVVNADASYNGANGLSTDTTGRVNITGGQYQANTAAGISQSFSGAYSPGLLNIAGADVSGLGTQPWGIISASGSGTMFVSSPVVGGNTSGDLLTTLSGSMPGSGPVTILKTSTMTVSDPASVVRYVTTGP